MVNRCMRELIQIIEAMNVGEHVLSDEFEAAIKAWGNNTCHDRKKKEAALFAIEHEFTTFREPYYEWLYRGHMVNERTIRALERGETVTLPCTSLMSWTTDLDVADTFARDGDGEFGVVIAKHDLDGFLDFEMLGRWLHRHGYDMDGFDYDLTDPIRESEVIVRMHGPLVIRPEDVWHYYDGIERRRLRPVAEFEHSDKDDI